uniref:Uncharacterized protein n=1 Tax=viral metagenome TaxID=1070528 RepID=A0A6H1ZAK7_9ZZZZ
MTTIRNRYVVGANGVGVLDTARTKRAAFDAARNAALSDRSLDGVYVEDRLAHIGTPWLWYYHPRDDALYMAGVK